MLLLHAKRIQKSSSSFTWKTRSRRCCVAPVCLIYINLLNLHQPATCKSLESLVSADGFEPSTHALKEYTALGAGVSKKGQEWRDCSMFMRARGPRPLFLLPSAHPCYFHQECRE
jgi:hypothetical protein